MYQYEFYCDNCKKQTQQVCEDSGHERDSSGDWRICRVCLWRYSGYDGEYSEPYDDYERSVVVDFDRRQELEKDSFVGGEI